jgi:hypothetical protein
MPPGTSDSDTETSENMDVDRDDNAMQVDQDSHDAGNEQIVETGTNDVQGHRMLFDCVLLVPGKN